MRRKRERKIPGGNSEERTHLPKRERLYEEGDVKVGYVKTINHPLFLYRSTETSSKGLIDDGDVQSGSARQDILKEKVKKGQV
jgi:hypothetical protein